MPDPEPSPLLARDHDGVRLLTLNRPDKLNALNNALTQALLDALWQSDADAGVRAAGEMQAVIAGSRPAGYPVLLHIGLHYGPVLVEKDDVFGDTVNVAAYLAVAGAFRPPPSKQCPASPSVS